MPAFNFDNNKNVNSSSSSALSCDSLKRSVSSIRIHKEKGTEQSYAEVLKAAPSYMGKNRDKEEKEEASAGDIWNIFKDFGNIKDTILPRKRDKRNKRFGFVKTISELEAGRIISNANEKGGLGAKIRKSINGDVRQGGNKEHEKQPVKKNVEKKSLGKSSEKNNSKPIIKYSMGDSEGMEEPSLGNRMFEFMDAAIDEEVEK
ncbi:hypothetical protein POM88_003282 [Heracleum sosnowskyi]|uniref:RRM domain-containing protein n=1 Tax=Heracleum sosnowskyi TaxID=360622 RepID=A0AAD8JJJ1_9APIA|nr:hypothetical protein POM88_003282 [Heracleum sosnowskyi]